MAVNMTKGAAPAASKHSTGTPAWMLKGDAAKTAFNEAEAKAQMAAEGKGKAFPFWIGKKDFGKDFPVTFLDGTLDKDGMLDVPLWNEHRVYAAGKWIDIVCVAGQEPCPCCESGDRAGMVGALTVIDHTPYSYTNKEGKTIVLQNRLRLYKPTRTTIKKLNKQAEKRGGSLFGCTFNVSRTDEKSPKVGDQFEFVEKLSAEQIKAKYGVDPIALNYGEEIVYRTSEELAKIGIKKGSISVGSEAGPDDGQPGSVDQEKLKNAL